MQPFVADTLAQLQPNALAFNGCINQDSKNTTPANCITPNSLRWIGTESGQAPQDTWSAGYSGAGDPASDIYQPSEADTTLQNGDTWFYDGSVGIRSLQELQAVYHNTVGHNSFLMMDFAPNKDGLIADDQAARYKELGDWIRGCYGSTPAAQLSGVVATLRKPVVLPLPKGQAAVVDRVVLQEDQSGGQAVFKYVVEANDGTDGTFRQVAEGSSIGNKRIHLLGADVNATTFRLTITEAARLDVTITRFALHKCN